MGLKEKENYFKSSLLTNAYKMDLKLIKAVCSNRCVPFEVDKVDGKVKMTTRGVQKHIESISLFLVTLWIFVFAVRLVYRRLTGGDQEIPISESLLDLGWGTLILSIFVYKIEYHTKAFETVQLLNETHEWEKEFIAAGTKTVYKHLNEEIIWPATTFLAYLTNVGLPVATALLALHSPCLNIFLGSLILPCQTTNDSLFFGIDGLTNAKLSAIGFAILEWIVADQNIGPGILANIPINYYFTVSLRTFLIATLEGKETRRFGTKSLLLYKRFQIHTTAVNICLGPVIYPMMAYTWSVLLIVGVYTGIRLFHKVPFAMYMLFILLGIDGYMVINFVFKACGRVNQLSQDLLGVWTSDISSDKSETRKLRIKQMKACPQLKIKMGNSNFFEIGTPLVLLDFCVNQIVTLLLTT